MTESMLDQGGLPVGTYGSYAAAQKAVDYLADNEFPVENLTIVGTGLRQVEKVTGRLTRGRVAAAGAAAGAWWGLLIGLLLGLFATTGSGWIGAVAVGLLLGALFGLVMALVGYAATGGNRDFTSVSGLVAESYQVLCVAQHAEQARGLLAKLSLSTG